MADDDGPVITGIRHEKETHDRLTRLADVALTAIKADPAYREGDRVLVALHDDGHPAGNGGIGTLGYDVDSQITSDLAMHLRAVLSG